MQPVQHKVGSLEVAAVTVHGDSRHFRALKASLQGTAQTIALSALQSTFGFFSFTAVPSVYLPSFLIRSVHVITRSSRMVPFQGAVGVKHEDALQASAVRWEGTGGA